MKYNYKKMYKIYLELLGECIVNNQLDAYKYYLKNLIKDIEFYAINLRNTEGKTPEFNELLTMYRNLNYIEEIIMNIK